MSLYLTNAQFLFYYDRNRVANFLSDDPLGTPIPDGNLNTDPTLAELINSAEGEFNSACRLGRRYELGSLISYAATGPGAVIRKLIADLTWYSLISRRGLSEEETNKLAPSWSSAQQKMELLRIGERVFEIDDAPQAGLPSVVVLGNAAKGQIKDKIAFWGVFTSGQIITNFNPEDGG